jgi:hypothetical protein
LREPEEAVHRDERHGEEHEALAVHGHIVASRPENTRKGLVKRAKAA